MNQIVCITYVYPYTYPYYVIGYPYYLYPSPYFSEPIVLKRFSKTFVESFTDSVTSFGKVWIVWEHFRKHREVSTFLPPKIQRVQQLFRKNQIPKQLI